MTDGTASPRIPTDKIPECRPHLERGDHLRLYRFSPSDYQEIVAVFNGPHPETGARRSRRGAGGRTAQRSSSTRGRVAPDDDPEEIAEIARKLRSAAGLGDEPLGKVSNEDGGLVGKVKDKIG
jgi:Mn-containing catalase